MIIDLNAWAGHWGTFPIEGEVKQVRAALQAVGVEHIFLSPRHAAWCHNPHLCNELVYQAATEDKSIHAVPVLDPTIPSWREEMQRAAKGQVQWIKLLPAYSQFNLDQADELLAAAGKARIGVIVQTRIEDPRRQHPLTQVPDVPIRMIAEAARRHPGVIFVIGGGSWSGISEVKRELSLFSNLFADTSQLDGTNSVQSLVESGLESKLLFGSHAPFFVPLAAIARVINDLDNTSAAAIFSRNALKLMA